MDHMHSDRVIPHLGVIAGLDPAIPIRKVGASNIGMAGASPAMTIRLHVSSRRLP
jgi:hypothetical protein